MVNFGPLAAEIGSLVWGTPANFNGFRVLAALLHGTLIVRVSQTLRRWTEGASCIRQDGHHVGQWLTFYSCISFQVCHKWKSKTCFMCRKHDAGQWKRQMMSEIWWDNYNKDSASVTYARHGVDHDYYCQSLYTCHWYMPQVAGDQRVQLSSE